MIKKYSLLAFILISPHNLLCFDAYGAPVAYTKSDPLTPLDPMGNHLSNHLEPLSKTNNIPRQSIRNGNVSSRVLDTYKRNLDEAMGKKTSTQTKPMTIDPSIVTTTTGTTKSTTNEKIKRTSSEKMLKSDTSKDIKKTEASSQISTTNPTDQKIEKKTEDQKTTNVEKTHDKTNKNEKKEDQKTIEKTNAKKDDNTTLYEQHDTKKDTKKDARKQAYDGARPQLWYGGPWKRG
jgi:hypothetical protein